MTKTSENLDSVRTKHLTGDYLGDDDNQACTVIGFSRSNGAKFSRGFSSLRAAMNWVSSQAGSDFEITAVRPNVRPA
jgi:hypothetical protein